MKHNASKIRAHPWATWVPGMWSGTQKGFAISGRLPIHKYPASRTPAHTKGSFPALAMSAEQLWSKHHVHQALCSPTAAQLGTCDFSNKLSGKPNSIQKTLLINQLPWYSRSERGDTCHHGTIFQQNLPGEILLATVVTLETHSYEKLLQMAPGKPSHSRARWTAWQSWFKVQLGTHGWADTGKTDQAVPVPCLFLWLKQSSLQTYSTAGILQTKTNPKETTNQILPSPRKNQNKPKQHKKQTQWINMTSYQQRLNPPGWEMATIQLKVSLNHACFSQRIVVLSHEQWKIQS